MRNLSLPDVSTVTVSSAGNLIVVFVSPLWMIASGIVKLPPNVPDPIDVIFPLPASIAQLAFEIRSPVVPTRTEP